MHKLGQANLDSLLLEGGAGLSDSAFRMGLVHRVVAYVAPKIIGGTNAKTPVGGQGVCQLHDAVRLGNLQAEPIGSDWKLTADVIGTVARRTGICLPES